MSSITNYFNRGSARSIALGLAALALEYAAVSLFKMNDGAGALHLLKAYALELLPIRATA